MTTPRTPKSSTPLQKAAGNSDSPSSATETPTKTSRQTKLTGLFARPPSTPTAAAAQTKPVDSKTRSVRRSRDDMDVDQADRRPSSRKKKDDESDWEQRPSSDDDQDDIEDDEESDHSDESESGSESNPTDQPAAAEIVAEPNLSSGKRRLRSTIALDPEIAKRKQLQTRINKLVPQFIQRLLLSPTKQLSDEGNQNHQQNDQEPESSLKRTETNFEESASPSKRSLPLESVSVPWADDEQKKMKCPFPGCSKMLTTAMGMRSHLIDTPHSLQDALMHVAAQSHGAADPTINQKQPCIENTNLVQMATEITQILSELNNPIPSVTIELEFDIPLYKRPKSYPFSIYIESMLAAENYNPSAPLDILTHQSAESSLSSTPKDAKSSSTAKLPDMDLSGQFDTDVTPSEIEEYAQIQPEPAGSDTQESNKNSTIQSRLRKLIGTLINNTIVVDGNPSLSRLSKITNKSAKPKQPIRIIRTTRTDQAKTFNCPVPGCERSFTTLPGYRYHALTTAHDLVAMLQMIETEYINRNANDTAADAMQIEEPKSAQKSKRTSDITQNVDLGRIIHTIRELVKTVNALEFLVCVSKFEFAVLNKGVYSHLPIWLSLNGETTVPKFFRAIEEAKIVIENNDMDCSVDSQSNANSSSWTPAKPRSTPKPKSASVTPKPASRLSLTTRNMSKVRFGLTLEMGLSLNTAKIILSEYPTLAMLKAVPLSLLCLVPDNVCDYLAPSSNAWTILPWTTNNGSTVGGLAATYMPPSQPMTVQVRFSKQKPLQEAQIQPFTSTSITRSKKDANPSLYLNVGMPVWALKWCPMPAKPHGQKSSELYEYLAVAGINTQLSEHIVHGFRYTTPKPNNPAMHGCIQIWRVPSKSMSSDPSSAVLDLVIVHNHGHVVHMDWCKPVMYDASVGNFGRLGFLAVCFGDGTACVYNVPIPHRVRQSLPAPESDPVLLHVHTPVLTLRVPDGLVYRCAWGAVTSLAFGLQDGRVLCIDPSYAMRHGDFHINRDLVVGFQAQSALIRDMVWCTYSPNSQNDADKASTARYLATSSLDGNICVHDVQDPYICRYIQSGNSTMSPLTWSDPFNSFVFVNVIQTVSMYASVLVYEADRNAAKTLVKPIKPEKGGDWSYSASPRLPFASIASADGSVTVSNVMTLKDRVPHRLFVVLADGSASGRVVFDETTSIQTKVVENAQFRAERLSAAAVSAGAHVTDWAWMRAGLHASGGMAGWVRIDNLMRDE